MLQLINPLLVLIVCQSESQALVLASVRFRVVISKVHYMTVTLFFSKQCMKGKQEKEGYLTLVTSFFEKKQNITRRSL